MKNNFKGILIPYLKQERLKIQNVALKGVTVDGCCIYLIRTNLLIMLEIWTMLQNSVYDLFIGLDNCG